MKGFSFFAVWVVALFGCGGGGEKLTPVGGKVTVGGVPLAAGSVTFHPDSDKGNSSLNIAVGALDAEGTYKLMTGGREGAPLGWYKVTVTAQAPIDLNNPYAMPKHLIKPKFSDASTSGLAIEVVARPAPGAYDLKLTK
mgnify:CR=1 FL=1